MGFIQRFERKLEDVVGNTFARVFGGKIVPAEVEDALQREASRGLQHQGGHALAPNHYVLTVSESDEESLTSDTELTLTAFAKHLTGFINAQGWETYGAVSVELESSPHLHTGQFHARSVITPDDDSARPGADPDRVPHQQPGVMQMSREPHPRYQPQPGRQQYQYPDQQEQPNGPPHQAYSQRPPSGPAPQYQQPQYQQPQYQQPQYQQPQYPAEQYGEPDPPVQAYSQSPRTGQNPQRYGDERYEDPRFRPPPHLYPPQQPQAGQPAEPQQQDPQQPAPHPYAPQQSGQDVPHGYQDQAYVGEEYPLRDPSPVPNFYADDHYSPHGGTPQQRADGLTVSLELGDGSDRRLELRRGSNIIGRGQDAYFRIPDTGVSRQHADIQWNGAVALIVDLQSTNGTVVNDIPINEWQLADGDVIRIGHSDITVRFH